MLGKNVNVLRNGWLAVALLGAVACGPSEEILQQLAELEVVSAQKDSLVQAVAEYAQAMSDISAELAEVEVEGRELLVAVESPLEASRDSVLGKIRYINERMERAEASLRQSRRRIAGLTHLSDSLKASLESTIANYESVLATQRETMAELTEQITGLEAEKEQLASEMTALEDEVSQVYYVIGTKDELLERGIIQKEGGARLLFIFGKRGETLVPNRDLDPADFTAIDRRQVTEIEFPNPEAAYTVVSRHDLEFLENTPDEDGNLSGSLRIASPADFWSASPFLIIVESD
jgi:hypothetical protein